MSNRKNILLNSLILIISSLGSVNTFSKEKEPVCFRGKNGIFHLKNTVIGAIPPHLRHHYVRPGEMVPNELNLVFDGSCRKIISLPKYRDSDTSVSLQSTAENCPAPHSPQYTAAGIPLLNTNPGAPVSLYVDFDGGEYGGEQLSGFNRTVEEGSDGNPLTFDSMEQNDITTTVTYLDQYYAMFDINVTTDPEVRDNSTAWGWIIITEDHAGGNAHLSYSAIGQPTVAKGYSAAARSRPESSNRSRTLASEFGHNFLLRHQGEYEDGVFYKLDSWSGFDGVRGAIMGSGNGQVNGWRLGDHDGRDGGIDLQDDLEMIRQRILNVAGTNYFADGFRQDDHPNTPNNQSTFCLADEQTMIAEGIIERTNDRDSFLLPWDGGTLYFQANPKGVSAVDLIATIYDDTGNIISEINSPSVLSETMVIQDLTPGNYHVEMKSRGGYGELGSYQVTIQDDSAGPPDQGSINVQVTESQGDAEENPNGNISLGSSDLEMVTDSNPQIVGIRFNEVHIPQGAVVNKAYIQFQTDEASADFTELDIFGELNPNPLLFTYQTFNISQRTVTSQSAKWIPEAWLIKNEQAAQQQTSDLSAVVQEVINQNNWLPGNPMVFIIQGEGKRIAESFDGSRTGAPKLFIEYGYEDNTEGEDPNEDEVIEEPLASGPVITTSMINTGADDVEENDAGVLNFSSSDLELVYDGNNQTVGLRFTHVDLPTNATVHNAYVQFTAKGTSTSPANLTIAAELSPHAINFRSELYNASNRPQTSTTVSWNPAQWTVNGENDVLQQTPDISGIIHEVITSPGWLEENAMVLLISGEGRRRAFSYNGYATQAPQLVIEYEIDPNTTPEPMTQFSVAIDGPANDVEEDSQGIIDFTSSDLELVEDRGETQTIGLRFTQVNIPQYAEIVDARIEFQADGTSSGIAQLTLSGELVGNSSPFTQLPYNVSGRLRTLNQVSWDVSEWRMDAENGPDQRTPNLSVIIQDIVNQGAWSEGNNMTLLIEGRGKRRAISADENLASAARLLIKYR